uniref:Uncharacterized protein n=1 Tax=Anopheles coluzzii TaxID=1518534 RepID=A0A8W7PRA3_ANOCL
MLPRASAFASQYGDPDARMMPRLGKLHLHRALGEAKIKRKRWGVAFGTSGASHKAPFGVLLLSACSHWCYRKMGGVAYPSRAGIPRGTIQGLLQHGSMVATAMAATKTSSATVPAGSRYAGAGAGDDDGGDCSRNSGAGAPPSGAYYHRR